MKIVWIDSPSPTSASSTYFQNFHSPPSITSNPTCSNTYKYPKFTTIKFKVTHIFSALLKNQIQLNFTHLRFNFSLNTNPNSLLEKKKIQMPLNGFIRIVNSKYKNYMVTIWFAYGENITFWTQFPNKIKKKK